MALEDLTGTKYIDSLNSSNPTATDGVNEGDDHLRGIKNVLKQTFANVSGAITSTHTELNLLDGVTSTTAELNELDASAAAVSNYTDGIRAFVGTGDHTTTFVSISGAASGGVFESFGPTGSGATNTWTALDDLPSGCAAILAMLRFSTNPDSTGTTASVFAYARQTGASVALGASTIIGAQTLWAGVDSITFDYRQVVIPLDASNRFDAAWSHSNASASAVELRLVGFVK